MPGSRSYDVVIVGGGVVGCAIARRLSFTTASVALLEAAHDVGEGASKGNTGITTCGADCTPGTLEATLVRRSAPGWETLCASLDTPFERLGTLCVALTGEDEQQLEPLREEAAANGAEAHIVDATAARLLEPLVTDRALAALHIPEDGIIDSLRLTIGYAELAARNGVDVHLSTPVTGFQAEGDRLTRVLTPGGAFSARYVVNAAGVEADTISRSGRWRNVALLAPARAVLAAGSRAGRAILQSRRWRPHAGHSGYLLRPHHQPLAAARPHRHRPQRPWRPCR